MAVSSGESPQIKAGTRRPKTAGIFSIIAGVIGLIGSPIMITFGTFGMLEGWSGMGEGWWGFYLFQAGFLFIITGIIAILGGIFALIRKIWWIALAGSICAIICFLPLGIPSIIFIVHSKSEFAQSNLQ